MKFPWPSRLEIRRGIDNQPRKNSTVEKSIFKPNGTNYGDQKQRKKVIIIIIIIIIIERKWESYHIIIFLTSGHEASSRLACPTPRCVVTPGFKYYY